MRVLSRASRVRWHPDTLFRNLEGEAVLLGASSAAYYGLDAVGTRVWELIGEHEVLEGVARAVVDEYDVGEPEAMADVIGLVTDLAKHGLVEIIG